MLTVLIHQKGKPEEHVAISKMHCIWETPPYCIDPNAIVVSRYTTVVAVHAH